MKDMTFETFQAVSFFLNLHVGIGPPMRAGVAA